MKTLKQTLSGKIIKICLFIIPVFFLVNCSGPEGPMGPQGPSGYDGIDGKDGVDGTSFAYSVIYDVEPTAWQGDVNGYSAVLAMPEITETIFNNGAVLVYRLIEIDPKSFNMLPYTYVDNGLTIYMDFDAYIGSINLLYKEILNGANDTFVPDELMSFKVLIVEGIPLTALKNVVDIKDYDAVSKMLNVKERIIKESRAK